MKKTFSTAWKASKQPRKQRKYLAKAPFHLKRKQLSTNLSKELRKKYSKRSISLRKGDIVRIMRGKFKKQKGKVLKIKTVLGKIYVEGMQTKKIDGSKINVPLRASNLQIIELNMEDNKRAKKLGVKTERKQADKNEEIKVQGSSTKEEVKKEESKTKEKKDTKKKVASKEGKKE